MRQTVALLTALIGITVSGCDLVDWTTKSTGAIRGRVLHLNGATPANGVRVTLDTLTGNATLTDNNGEFFLGGAGDGPHFVYAYDPLSDTGGAAQVVVDFGEAFLGDIILQDCVGVLEDAAGTSPDPNVPTAFTPCSGDGLPPQPQVLDIEINVLTSAWAEAYVKPNATDGYGEFIEAPVAADFTIELQLDFQTGSGKFSGYVQNDYNGGTVQALLGLQDLFSSDYYLLNRGQLDLTVHTEQDGTRWFQLLGSDLFFEFWDWNTGQVDPSYSAHVGSMYIDGPAFEDPSVSNPL